MTREEKVRKAISVLMDCADAAKGTEFADYYLMGADSLRQQETVTDRHQLNEPLTLAELRSRAGGWVWVVANYEHCKCDGWALVPTPTFVAYLDQTIPIDFYGKKFVAYDHKPEED